MGHTLRVPVLRLQGLPPPTAGSHTSLCAMWVLGCWPGESCSLWDTFGLWIPHPKKTRALRSLLESRRAPLSPTYSGT